MAIEPQRYPTDSYVGTFSPDNEKDMQELQMVRDMVSRFNEWNKQRGDDYRWRVVIRGRKPYQKMKAVHPHYTFCNSKGDVSYDYFGNIVGGIKNASLYKAYIYRR